MAEKQLGFYANAAQVLREGLAENGRAAVVHPNGVGSGRIVWAWLGANPEASMIWLVPSELKRRLRLEEAARLGQALPPQVLLCSAEQLQGYSAQAWVKLAERRPFCLIVDGVREFTAVAWEQSVQRLRRLCPEAGVVGLLSPDQPEGCCVAEELFRDAVVCELSLPEAMAEGLMAVPTSDTVLLWPAENALQAYLVQRRNQTAVGLPDAGEKAYASLCRAVERSGPAAPRLQAALPAGRLLVLCEDAAALARVQDGMDVLFGQEASSIIMKNGWDAETAAQFAAGQARLLVCVIASSMGALLPGLSGAVLVRSTGDAKRYRQMVARALALCGQAAPLVELNAVFEGLGSAQSFQQEAGVQFPLNEPLQSCIRFSRQLQRQLDAQWEQAYAAAKETAAHEELNELPRSYATKSGLQLGRWWEQQRQVRAGEKPGRLTAEQAAKLEKLGIVWKQKLEQAWERGLASAARYRKAHGDLMVPVRYHDKNGFTLGEWIVYNRQRYLGGSLSADRIERLQALGMVWDTTEALWQQSYAAAVQYYLAHHTLEVPVKYVTPDGLALGVWLGSQRAAYKEGSLTAEQMAWLEALDIDWTNRNDRKWQAAYEAAVRYYKANGNLNVPSEYIDADGVLLGKWVSRQRYAWQNPERSSARVTPERKALLDQIGMVWQKPDSWQHRYELAQAYKAAHGSLEMPTQYCTEDGIWLGSWLNRQKQMLQKGDPGLSEAHEKALRELFKGEKDHKGAALRRRTRCSVREQNWLNNYHRAKVYAKRRGDLLVPASYVDETGFRLGVWVSNLRAARKMRPSSFQVTPEHIALLDEIGMQWDAREAKWQCALRRAEEYFAAHGNLLVPVNYKTEDGFCLGDWVRRMRECYAKQDAKLTPARVAGLNALGMVWAPAEG